MRRSAMDTDTTSNYICLGYGYHKQWTMLSGYNKNIETKSKYVFIYVLDMDMDTTSKEL